MVIVAPAFSPHSVLFYTPTHTCTHAPTRAGELKRGSKAMRAAGAASFNPDEMRTLLDHDNHGMRASMREFLKVLTT